jgi:hypothetical protein
VKVHQVLPQEEVLLRQRIPRHAFGVHLRRAGQQVLLCKRTADNIMRSAWQSRHSFHRPALAGEKDACSWRLAAMLWLRCWQDAVRCFLRSPSAPKSHQFFTFCVQFSSSSSSTSASSSSSSTSSSSNPVVTKTACGDMHTFMRLAARQQGARNSRRQRAVTAAYAVAILRKSWTSRAGKTGSWACQAVPQLQFDRVLSPHRQARSARRH